jgi:hydrogenase maturation protein HypF
MGRLFDAVASIAGIRQKVNYEAQAAIEFEALADPAERGVYEIDIVREDNSGSLIYMIDPAPLLQELLSDIHKEIAISTISARFHNSIAGMVCDVCRVIRDDFSVDEVVLSGGVWQNMTLLRVTVDLLEKDGFKVHIHHKVPTNDGGLALGQAVIAIHRMKNTGS